MYFASSLGRGFIISDDEEITGVISVRNKVANVPSQGRIYKSVIYVFRRRSPVVTLHFEKNSPTHSTILSVRRNGPE